MDFDKAVETALKTWYPKDHDLHLNPHHPLGKLLGEWGELLDDYMKSLYKPGYEFKPQDELGDIWYYVRILCYQSGYKPKILDIWNKCDLKTDSLIANIMIGSAFFFRDCTDNIVIDDSSFRYFLDKNYNILSKIAKRYNLTLDDLTASNWEKLKPGSERGEQWAKARIQTDYKGGKIGLK